MQCYQDACNGGCGLTCMGAQHLNALCAYLVLQCGEGGGGVVLQGSSCPVHVVGKSPFVFVFVFHMLPILII